MTDATQIVPIRPSSPLHPSEAQALAAEVAKCLKLVAPSNMGAEQQTVWLHAAVDALTDIRASEVAAISAELRRTVTRPAQIVPEISKLVAQKRARTTAGESSLDAINAERVRLGFGAVQWVRRDGQLVCEFVDPPQGSLGK